MQYVRIHHIFHIQIIQRDQRDCTIHRSGVQRLTCVTCVANDKTLSTLFVGRHFKLCEIAFYMKPWNRKATRASRQSLMTLMDLFLFDLFVPLFMVLNCRPIASMTYLSYIYICESSKSFRHSRFAMHWHTCHHLPGVAENGKPTGDACLEGSGVSLGSGDFGGEFGDDRR